MGARAPWNEAPRTSSRQQPRFLTDRDGVVSDLNLDACVVLDYGRKFLLGKRLALLVARDDVPRFDALLRSIDGSAAEARVRLRNRLGALHPVSVRAALAADGLRVRWTAELGSQEMTLSS